ncbi:MAG: PilZ domain-containing protein [Candidatus Magnetoovum sp. WYHC-5]|nr:PilZ domain-containing protein [Candidatus Magnetoovum sp. WYHC-5]
MEERKKSKFSLQVGDSLPFSVYDENGALIGRKGYKIADEKQLERLMQVFAKGDRPSTQIDVNKFANISGTLIDAVENEIRELIGGKSEKEDKTLLRNILEESPHETIAMMQARLANILRNAQKDKDFEKNIIDICENLQDTCQKDEDMAIASIIMTNAVSYSIRHQVHTAIVCEIVSKYLGWSKTSRLYLLAAALTMNIAMWQLQDMLHKQTRPLSSEQKDEIYSHAQRGVEQLMSIGIQNSEWLDYVMTHHEVLNGTGYPYGVKGEQIPKGTKILSCADVYCARISPRSYKPTHLPTDIMKELFKDGQKIFEQEVVLALAKNLGMFPPGVFVRLKNNEIGIVTQRGGKVYWPIVHVVFKANGDLAMGIVKRDTSRQEFAIVEEIPSGDRIEVDPNKYWGYSVYTRKKVFKRKHVRVNTNISAKLLDTERGIVADANVANLSLGGCLLKVNIDSGKFFEVDSSYILIFNVFEHFMENLEFIIRNITETTSYAFFGCQFHKLSSENEVLIGNYIETIKNPTKLT